MFSRDRIDSRISIFARQVVVPRHDTPASKLLEQVPASRAPKKITQKGAVEL